ncbi:MAG: hypothetical protein K5985_00135 [Lachnospiraceae bacterium]|nr:hypothetical protein [Lachnospiraceae bacterium]
MKREILRINELNYTDNEGRRLKDVSFYLASGDRAALMGLANSGRDALVGVLTGSFEADFSSCGVFLNGERIISQRLLTPAVYRMSPALRMIGSWSVAEYLLLMEHGYPGNIIISRRAMEERTQEILSSFGIEIDASNPISRLSELEKWLLELVRAMQEGVRILLIEDEFDSLREEEIDIFAGRLKEIASDKAAVIVNSHSDLVSGKLSERYLIFKNGGIVKKCRKAYITGPEQLERFFLSGSVRSRKKTMDVYQKEPREDEEIIYRIFRMRLPDGSRRDLYFRKGAVTTFLISDEKQKRNFFNCVSGLWTNIGCYRILNGKRFRSMTEDTMVEKRLVVIRALGDPGEIFTNMDLGDNLLLPSLRKISGFEYLKNGGRLSVLLSETVRKSGILSDTAEERQDVNDIICITLERWFVFRPQVLFMLEPFARCDAYGSMVVRSYIRKFAMNGTAVVLIKSRDEYVGDLSDQILNLG